MEITLRTGQILICILTAVFSMLLLFGCDDSKSHEQLFGLTIDDVWYDDVELDDVTEGMENLDCRPTVRIVMSGEIEPADYVEMFRAVEKHADIMACPVDSFIMKNYEDDESYLKRFEDSYEHLSSYVSIWEVGNEINGTEWIQQEPELIVDKICSAADFIKSKDGKIALTLYCTNSPQRDMIDWSREYIPEELAKSADYCLVSYYEDDNDGYSPDWENIFEELGEIFPKSYLGIGECGNTAEDATQNSKIAMVKKYYQMPKYHERFVGGYFWWNWVVDCIPHEGNKVYEAINNCVP
ncbi:MAG: hypothetical protein ACOX4R_00780 [Lentihominibacter sp.]|jgi:hypothetical protein